MTSRPLRYLRRAIDAVGLRRPASILWSQASWGERGSSWRVIAQDISGCRHIYRSLARGIPSGAKDNPVWVVSAFSSIHGIKLEAAIGLMLRLAGYHPVVVEASRNPWIGTIHRLVGTTRFVDWWRLAAWQRITPVHPDFLQWKNADASIAGLIAMRYREVDIGRIALSNYLDRNKRASINFRDPMQACKILQELVSVASNILVAEAMFRRHRPTLAVVMEKGFSPAAELIGVCLANAVPVIQYSGAVEQSDLFLKRYSAKNRHSHLASLDAVTWNKVLTMPWQAPQEAAVLQMIEDGYREGTWFNRKFLHADKLLVNREDVVRQLGLDPNKKTAVVFSHVLWDATFFYGDNLFDDYETWLRETVAGAIANTNLNWVIKLHPDLRWKDRQEKGVVRREFAMFGEALAKAGHVKLVPPETGISTYSFLQITDFCLTVRGTIGIEMACHGVPVVTAGTGRYSGLGFTRDFTSDDAYRDCLASLQEAPPMNSSEIERARRYAYCVFGLRPWKLRSFRLQQSTAEDVDNVMANNLAIHIGSSDEFRRAPDIQAFVSWVGSGTTDFLSE